MPPRTRATPSSSTAATEKRAPRTSRLARENDISAAQEGEIKEAFHLFAVPNDSYPDEVEGVIPKGDVRRCLLALGIPPSDPSELTEILDALDPDNDGYVTYAPFVAICALKLNSRTEDSIDMEVDEAYRLFTKGGPGPITVNHLRRVAREIKEDVDEGLLRAMVNEANAGAGVSKGVGLEEFRGIMVRAGLFSA